MSNWTIVCKNNELVPGTGVCALYEGDQVAIFKMKKDNSLFAVSNYDPFSEANVISRGILGSLNSVNVVASPLYKQHFCLLSGVCFEDDSQRLKIYRVRLDNGNIEIKST